LKKPRLKPGLAVSSAAHAGLLLATLLAFSDARKFDDAQETVPVDIVTDSPINEVMKGEKTAKEIKPTQRVDKIADTAETKPLPPLAEAKKDISAPPPPLRPRQPEPAEDRPETPPPPPKRVAALPPPPAPEPPSRPTPAKPELVKTESKPEPPQKPQQAKAAPAPAEEEPEEAEIVRPKPPVRPKPEQQAKEAPQQPEKPKPPKEDAKKPEAKSKEAAKAKEDVKAKPESKAKDEPRLKVDEVAKLLEQKKTAEKSAPSDQKSDAKSDKPPAKPKSGDEAAPKSKFDAASIASLLSHEAPQRKAATGKETTKTAALGAPTASAARMSPSLQAQIDAYTVEHYRKCWETSLSIDARAYVPQVELHLTRDGALEGPPRLLNPSSNPVERSRGEQALGAVRRCSPMPIPPAFEPHYDYWRATVLNMTNDM
jgi:colicin import membrane protein